MRRDWETDRQFRKSVRRVWPTLFLLLIPLILLTGCFPVSRKYPAYSPHENLLSITAEFKLLASRDPYREGIAPDLTGRNIAKATLLRLKNYQDLHPGRLTPEVLTLEGRAREWLGDYEGARRAYLDAAEYETELSEDNLRRAGILLQILILLEKPVREGDLMGTLSHLNNRAVDLRLLADELEDPFYSAIALRDAEQDEVRRSELMAANRWMLLDGDKQALEAFESLVTRNQNSRLALSHALRLANFHRSLAEEEVRLHPPEGLEFLTSRFQEHFEEAADLYFRISQADGRPERLVARHELEALLAYGREVQNRAQ